MRNHCLSERANSLVNAASREQLDALSLTIQHIHAEMNSRGLFNISSEHANKICQACASELKAMAEVIWTSIKRAHESCGSPSSKSLPQDLRILFCNLLENEKAKLELLQAETLRSIILQNKTLIQSQLLTDEHDHLVHNCDIEIDIYIDNLKYGIGNNFYDRLRNNFLNNGWIAVAVVIVVVIIALATFTDSLSKLSIFVKVFLGNG